MGKFFLRWQTTDGLIRLFKRETGWSVDEVYVDEFRRWVEQQSLPKAKQIFPRDYYIWFLQRVHEYLRLSR